MCACAEGLNQYFYFSNNRLDGTTTAAVTSTCQKAVILNAPNRDACLYIDFLSQCDEKIVRKG